MCACSAAHLCLTPCDPMDYSPPGSSVWNFPGKNTGVSCHFLLQRIFPTHGSNLCLWCLLHCRWIPYCLATREAHVYLYMYIFPGKGSDGSCDLPSSKWLRCFPFQGKFIEKLLVTWKYNIIIMSCLQTTNSELDTVLGSYTKLLILLSHPIRHSSSHFLRKGNWGSKRFIKLSNTYSWQVTEVEFYSKLLIPEYTHPMSKVRYFPHLFYTKIYPSPIHWCFIVTWPCQIDNLWENALCVKNLRHRDPAWLKNSRKKWKGEGNLVWSPGRTSMSIRGGRDLGSASKAWEKNTLLRMSGSSAQGVWQKHITCFPGVSGVRPMIQLSWAHCSSASPLGSTQH